MGTLLEATGIMLLETYFEFGFSNRFPVGDSLICIYIGYHFFWEPFVLIKEVITNT